MKCRTVDAMFSLGKIASTLKLSELTWQLPDEGCNLIRVCGVIVSGISSKLDQSCHPLNDEEANHAHQ